MKESNFFTASDQTFISAPFSYIFGWKRWEILSAHLEIKKIKKKIWPPKKTRKKKFQKLQKINIVSIIKVIPFYFFFLEYFFIFFNSTKIGRFLNEDISIQGMKISRLVIGSKIQIIFERIEFFHCIRPSFCTRFFFLFFQIKGMERSYRPHLEKKKFFFEIKGMAPVSFH